MSLTKEYDVVAIGTGSAMYVVDAIMKKNPRMKVAVIDKDEPGGICLTRGCIPSKLLLYPAEMVRTIQRAGELNYAQKKKVKGWGMLDSLNYAVASVLHCIFVTGDPNFKDFKKDVIFLR